MDEKRRHARYPIYCRIQYKRENDDERSPAVTMNLSEGGALIPAKDFIDIAAGLMIRIFLKIKNPALTGGVFRASRFA